MWWVSLWEALIVVSQIRGFQFQPWPAWFSGVFGLQAFKGGLNDHHQLTPWLHSLFKHLDATQGHEAYLNSPRPLKNGWSPNIMVSLTQF